MGLFDRRSKATQKQQADSADTSSSSSSSSPDATDHTNGWGPYPTNPDGTAADGDGW